MHYFIDGYNLLFRLIRNAKDDLKTHRDLIIHDLNKKISVINLDVSIVFDSNSQFEESAHSHFGNIEIFFTRAGKTADDFILDELKESLCPRQEIIVTSDKKLAWQARQFAAQTQNINEFILKLNRAYTNKLKQIKQTPIPPLIVPVSPVYTNNVSLPTSHSSETSQDRYLAIFETKWQEILKQEEDSKQKRLAAAPQKRQPKKNKQQKDPFQPPLSVQEKEANDMQRWLKTFEARILDTDEFS